MLAEFVYDHQLCALHQAGLTQGFLPPLLRPDLTFLQRAGFTGSNSEIIASAATSAPALLKASYSASAMWAANAATVSPSADTSDGRLHLTVANLSTMLHRSLEHTETLANLRTIFSDAGHFCIHEALPQHPDFADEGAANHVRLCAEHGGHGVELFVFGRSDGEANSGFPARQTELSTRRIAAMHGLDPKRTVMARQSVAAINAGAFHNDVVCVGTLDTLFTHELAFEDKEATYNMLAEASDGIFHLNIVEVPQELVPIEDAIRSYLFNSQLLKVPGEDRLVLLAPVETQETETTRKFCDYLTSSNGPIGRVQYVDVRESMRNGGGPACLRLRVVMTQAELSAMNRAYILDESKIDDLQKWVRHYYREQLSVADFADPGLVDELASAHQALTRLINTFT